MEAKEPRRPQDKHDDKNEESDGGLVAGPPAGREREVKAGGDLLGDAHDQGADECTVGAAYPAQNRGGEQGDEEGKAHFGRELGLHSKEHSRYGNPRAADPPGPNRNPVRINSTAPRQVGVVRSGAHRLPQLRPVEDKVDEGDEHERRGDYEYLVRLDLGVEGEVPGELDAGHVTVGLRAPEEEHRRPDYEGDPQGSDGKDRRAAAAQTERAKDDPVAGEGDNGDGGGGGKHGENHAEAEGKGTDAASGYVGKEGDVGAEGHHVAVGEVGEAEDAVDEGESDGAEGEDAADDDPDDEQLRLGEGRPDEQSADQNPDAHRGSGVAHVAEATKCRRYSIGDAAGQD